MICGRQWGKSLLSETELSGASQDCTRGALQTPNGWFMLVSRTAKHARIAWRRARAALEPVIARNRRGELEANGTELTIRLHNGALLDYRSADKPDLLLGPTLNGLVVDECTLVPGYLWDVVLRPMLSVKKGWALFTGTARGKRSWIYPLFLRGQKRVGSWASWTGPMTDNPLVTEEEVRDAKETLPDAFFRQEYLAEFLDDEVVFFQRLDEAYDGAPPTPARSPSKRYVLGVDLAKAENYSVVAILEVNPIAKAGRLRLVDFARWHRTDWNTTKGRILAVSDRWGARGLADATEGSVGSPIVEDLNRARAGRFEGFRFSERSKEDLLAGLQVALESGALHLPGAPEKPWFPEMDAELRGYGWNVSRTGKLKAGPRDGGNDDCVMALALAVRAASATCGYGAISHLERFLRASSEGIFGGTHDRLRFC